jgi:hypothetical protein
MMVFWAMAACNLASRYCDGSASDTDKSSPPSLGRLLAEGQPSPAVHKKKWSTIDVRL